MSKEKFSALHFKAYKDREFPIFVVTYGTADLGGKFAVRLHVTNISGNRPSTATEHYAVADTLEDVRSFMPDNCHVMQRHPNDDPVIVETWI